jgi:hypothetical protein
MNAAKVKNVPTVEENTKSLFVTQRRAALETMERNLSEAPQLIVQRMKPRQC